MSIEQDAFTAFVNQLEADATLSGYIKTFFYGGEEKVFENNDYPILHLKMPSIDEPPEDSYVALPVIKQNRLIFALDFKVWKKANDSGKSLILESLKADEYIKNAIESDLQLGGKANITRVSNTDFRYLDNYIREGSLTVELETPRFTAGSR